MTRGLVIVQAIEYNFRLIWSLCIRDLKKINRSSPIGIFSSILEPIVMIWVLATVFEVIKLRVPSLGDYFILFLMTGAVPLHAFSKGMGNFRRMVNGERSLYWVSHVRPLHLMLASLLETIIIMVSVVLLMVLFFKARFEIEEPRSLLMTLVPIVGNAIIGFGLGTLTAAIARWFPYWPTLFRLMTGPIGIMSGLFYLPSRLPNYILEYLWYNPFMHSIELCRQWFYFNYESTIFSPLYYSSWVFGAAALGLAIERIFNRGLTTGPA